MKNRNLIYVLALVFAVALAAPAGAVPNPPENPATYTTAYEVETTIGEPLTVKAYLENDAGEPLNDVEIKFILGEGVDEEGNIVGEIATAYGTTSTNGEAEATFDAETVPDTAGDYAYKAYFAGMTDPTYDSSQDTAAVTVNKIPTVLEVRTTDHLKRDRPGSRVRGDYSLNEIGGFYRTGPKRKSCVFIHTYTHSTPGVV